MTTMLDAITRVARQLGVAAAGQVPTANDLQDLLTHMQGVIDRLPLLRDGEWTDVLLTSGDDYTASDGERVSPQGFDPVITLPTTYTDDCSRTQIMRDLSRVHVIGDGVYVWSSTLGAWNKADGLTSVSPFPFGPEDLPGIVALTMIEAAPEYGAEASSIELARADAALKSLSDRFQRAVVVPADPGFLRLSDIGQRGRL